MTRGRLVLFRVLLAITVLLVLYLSTTEIEHDIVSDINDKLSHAVAFFVLSLLADYSFPESHFSWMKAAPLFAYGILIECIQYFLPYRSFSLFDIAGDAAGMAVYLLCLPLLLRLPVLRQREAANPLL